MMEIRKRLARAFDVILDEAARNREFAGRLERALSGAGASERPITAQSTGQEQFRRGRRPAAVLDPITSYVQGEQVLRDRLRALGIEQLRDIVAEYSMDPDKLAMKWKTPDRLIERIVEVARARATKGDAFRP